MENAQVNITDQGLMIASTLLAPVAMVWEVWTKPEHIVNWWGPNGFTNTIIKMDLQPGGEWELILHGPDGTDFKNKSIFKEVALHKRIVFQHFHPNFTATIGFEEQGGQTQLTWNMLFDSKEEFIAVLKAHKADVGLKQNVEKLEAYLQGLK